ncbi:Flp pilus assembly protein CpaB [Devosia sp. YIM 151766]|uniref:Flp pilus assembly protein CpaB n=1 Tax=Devosia sp. YIM 151766 TaxID=3017325 RepID=UPI00255CFDC1|nr:Flp pilus assembly protein CpaB [Devosia sp. YIM 151766]WIY53322.1 Flp pilus assembly protein CpaB [Devosia sp. YIM 151766]
MRPARIILLLVALVAGGLAAFLVTRGGGASSPQSPQVVTEVVEEAKTRILVAKTGIGIGERLGPASVEWQDWPQGALRSEYVTIAAMPDAPADLTDAVARFEFFPGEPIREAKLVRSDQGYLSAVLAQGKRGVSVGVTAASSAGGFVVPNDHVDVVLTTASASGQRSEVILSDVRVLAIGKRLGEMGASGGNEGDGSGPNPETFDSSTIATLELDPAGAETLINASTRGQLTLTLRSVADFNRVDPGLATASNQAVRIIRYGREQSVITGASPGEQRHDIFASADEAGFIEDNQFQSASDMPQVLPQ